MEAVILVLLIWFLFQGGSGKSGGCYVKKRPTTPRPEITVYPQYRKKT